MLAGNQLAATLCWKTDAARHCVTVSYLPTVPQAMYTPSMLEVTCGVDCSFLAMADDIFSGTPVSLLLSVTVISQDIQLMGTIVAELRTLLRSCGHSTWKLRLMKLDTRASVLVRKSRCRLLKSSSSASTERSPEATCCSSGSPVSRSLLAMST